MKGNVGFKLSTFQRRRGFWAVERRLMMSGFMPQGVSSRLFKVIIGLQWRPVLFVLTVGHMVIVVEADTPQSQLIIRFIYLTVYAALWPWSQRCLFGMWPITTLSLRLCVFVMHLVFVILFLKESGNVSCMSWYFQVCVCGCYRLPVCAFCQSELAGFFLVRCSTSKGEEFFFFFKVKALPSVFSSLVFFSCQPQRLGLLKRNSPACSALPCRHGKMTIDFSCAPYWLFSFCLLCKPRC